MRHLTHFTQHFDSYVPLHSWLKQQELELYLTKSAPVHCAYSNEEISIGIREDLLSAAPEFRTEDDDFNNQFSVGHDGRQIITLFIGRSNVVRTFTAPSTILQ